MLDSRIIRSLLLFSLLLALSCGSSRSVIPYNNIDYPRKGSVLEVYATPGTASVQVTRSIDFEQTKYYARYDGRVKVNLSDGSSKEYDIEWRSWIRPERIDFIIKPRRRGSSVLYNVMPKGYNLIYLQDDRTAVRLKYSKAEHWALIVDNQSRYTLLGDAVEQQLNPSMDLYPILYLSYVYADQLH